MGNVHIFGDFIKKQSPRICGEIKRKTFARRTYESLSREGRLLNENLFNPCLFTC